MGYKERNGRGMPDPHKPVHQTGPQGDGHQEAEQMAESKQEQTYASKRDALQDSMAVELPKDRMGSRKWWRMAGDEAKYQDKADSTSVANTGQTRYTFAGPFGGLVDKKKP